MPALLAESGKGRWRHQITDIVSTATPDDAAARTHGLVTDCNEGGRPVTFADYEASPRRIDGIWRFAPPPRGWRAADRPIRAYPRGRTFVPPVSPARMKSIFRKSCGKPSSNRLAASSWAS